MVRHALPERAENEIPGRREPQHRRVFSGPMLRVVAPRRVLALASVPAFVRPRAAVKNHHLHLSSGRCRAATRFNLVPGTFEQLLQRKRRSFTTSRTGTVTIGAGARGLRHCAVHDRRREEAFVTSEVVRWRCQDGETSRRGCPAYSKRGYCRLRAYDSQLRRRGFNASASCAARYDSMGIRERAVRPQVECARQVGSTSAGSLASRDIHVDQVESSRP